MRTRIDYTKNIIGIIIFILFIISITCLSFAVVEYNFNILTEERNITVINKTTEIVPHGFSSATEYLILGDDGNVYHAKEWKIYHDMRVGKRYNIKTKNLCGWGYPSDYWIIEEVKEVV